MFQFVKDLWPKRYELAGLGLVPALFVLVFTGVKLVFGESLWNWSCGTVAGLWFLIVWLCVRYVAPRHCYCVAMCLDCEDISVESVRKVAGQVATKLDQVDSRLPVRLKLLPRDVVRSSEEAQRYLKLSGVSVVIWGTYQRQRECKSDVDRCLKCQFNTRFVACVTDMQTLERYNKELEAFLAARWHSGIRFDESADDLPRAGEDYAEMILGLLAPVCLNAGDAISASQFAEALLARLGQKQSELAQYLRGLVVYALCCHLVWNPDLSWSDRRVILGHLWQYRALVNVRVVVDLARAAWECGDRAGALAYTEEIGRLDPSNPCYAFNMGFLCLEAGSYSDCAAWYGKAYGWFRARPYEIGLADLVAFLDTQRAEHPSEIGYLFALGVANCAGLDIELGYCDLRTFVREARNTASYAAMLERAKLLLAERGKRRSGSRGARSRRVRS